MKRFVRLLGLGGLLVGLPLTLGQVAPPPPPVSRVEIRHVGPPAVSDDLIRANLRMKEGDPFTEPGTNEEVRNLRATGYFYNVRVAIDAENGGIKVIYILTGKPVLTEIRFEGNTRYSERKLRKKVTSKIGEPLDEYKLHTAAQEMQKLYQKAGYQRTVVDPRVVINESLGRGVATFVITEAPKIRVTDVRFEGAEAFKQGKLRKVIKTRRHWVFSWLTGSGKLKDEQFQEDRQKLIEFYQDAGYIDFEIRDLQFLEPTPNRMVIQFQVFEGRQYKVGKVEFR